MAFLVAYDPRKPHVFAGAGGRFGAASFLCPVCAEPLYSDEGVSEQPCQHVLLAYDSSGEIRYTTSLIKDLLQEAQQHAEATGDDAMEALRSQLGMSVIFFELLDRPDGPSGVEAVTFVVDLEASSRVVRGEPSPRFS